MEPLARAAVKAADGPDRLQGFSGTHILLIAGENLVACPSHRTCAAEGQGRQAAADHNGKPQPESARQPEGNKRPSPDNNKERDKVGRPVPDSPIDTPPVIRRAEVVAFALVALLVIASVAVLYFAKAFFLPVATAFIVGTMLSPAAGFLERRGVPRSVSAVLIVTLACALVAFIVALISAPLVDWSHRLPELAELLKEKMRLFDRPLALWQQLQGMLGGSETLPGAPIQLPKIEWVQSTFEFLSPTLTEFLLFAATLVLFIATWRDLRKSLVMTFSRPRGTVADAADPQRDRDQPRRLPADRDRDQPRRRGGHRHHLRRVRHAQPGRAWRAGGDAELLSDHRAGGDVRDPRGGRLRVDVHAQRRDARAAGVYRT